MPEKVALTVTVIASPFQNSSSSGGPLIGKRGPRQVYHALHPTWGLGFWSERRLGTRRRRQSGAGRGGRTAPRIPGTSALSVYLRVAGEGGALGRSVEGVAARTPGLGPRFRSPCWPPTGPRLRPSPLGPVSPSPTPSPLRGRRGAASGRPPRLRRGERARRSASRDPGPPRARALTRCGAEKAKRSSRTLEPQRCRRWRSGGRGGGAGGEVGLRRVCLSPGEKLCPGALQESHHLLLPLARPRADARAIVYGVILALQNRGIFINGAEEH